MEGDQPRCAGLASLQIRPPYRNWKRPSTNRGCKRMGDFNDMKTPPKIKNKAAQELRALAHPDNMKRDPALARKAALAKWAKYYADKARKAS